jgi:catechol 2,3-dioxygenase-like lactoylglutathione lyase family enzyme
VLRDKDAMATVAVKDIEVARRFYEGTLGLKASDGDQPSVLGFETGGSTLLVYESQFAGTNQATAVTWTVGAGVEELVRSLKAKGVVFEHYDLPGMKRAGDLHVGGDMKVAWFKDPDGNIHSLVNR